MTPEELEEVCRLSDEAIAKLDPIFGPEARAKIDALFDPDRGLTADELDNKLAESGLQEWADQLDAEDRDDP